MKESFLDKFFLNKRLKIKTNVNVFKFSNNFLNFFISASPLVSTLSGLFKSNRNDMILLVII